MGKARFFYPLLPSYFTSVVIFCGTWTHGSQSMLHKRNQTLERYMAQPEPEPCSLGCSTSVGVQTEPLPVEFTVDIQHVRIYSPERVYIVWSLDSSYSWAGVHFGAPGWAGLRQLLEGGEYRASRDILRRQRGEPGTDLLGAAVVSYWRERRRHGSPRVCRIYYWAA
eukprot:1793210-Amphidinium_carterae.1